MKKYFYPVLAAGMLFATSCSQDQELVDVTKGEGQMVTFKVELPKTESRAMVDGKEIGGGKMATRLIYAQYEDGKNSQEDLLVAGIVNDSDNNGEFTVNLTMAKDINYDVLFMAYNPGNNIFGISSAINDAEGARTINLRELTINEELLANQEAYDAFVGLLDGANIKDDNKTVSLKRPFAQVNAVTTANDLNAADLLNIEVSHSSFTIVGAPNQYDILNEAASGTQNLSYNIAPMLMEDGLDEYPKYAKFDAEGNQRYLATVYVLAGEDANSDASQHDAEFKFYRGAEGNECVSTIDIVGLPIQRNYRTNVIGDLLTKSEEYTVTIEAGFTGDHNKLINSASTINELQEAINNAPDGVQTTIIVTSNISRALSMESRAAEGSITIPATKNIILDLNGFTISQEKACTASYSMIKNMGSLTITGNGKICFKDLSDGGGSDWGSYIIENNNGTLVIENGTLEHLGTSDLTNHDTCIPVQNYAGKITINGGTFSSPEFRSLRDFTAGGEIIINGGTFQGQIWMQGLGNGPSSLTINGGEFSPTAGYDGSSVFITNGTNDIDVSITGGTFNTKIGCSAADKLAGSITGGTFTTTAKDGTSETLFDKDYKLVEKEDGIWAVETVVAMIGDEEYTSLQDAFNAGGEITLVRNIKQDAIVTLPSNVTATLNLNGNNITGTDNTEKNFSIIDNRGTLTITGQGTISLKATVNSGWNRYSAVVANNPGGNLTVGEGVVIEHLGGTDMAYGIDNLTNGKGTSAKTTIDGATVKSPYRAVRQFLNGVEAINELHVKSGVIEGDNKSIWMQDPSKNANTGKLVVEDAAELKGDVYLFVTAGSSEWPVEVSIAAGALKDGAEVLTGNVPAGYGVILEGGIYKAVKNGEKNYVLINGADELIAVAEAGIKNNEKVFLIGDIDLEGKTFGGLKATNFSGHNTFDGQGYTVSNWKYEGGSADMGFIQQWVGPVKNIKFYNCHLKTGGRSAIAAGKIYGNIDNIHIDESSIEDSFWACGAVAGLYNAGSITNCTVTNTSVKSNGGTGGIVGVINEEGGERAVRNCSVSNSTIHNTGIYGDAYSGGGLIGMFNALNEYNPTYVIENCTVSKNTLEGAHIFEKHPEVASVSIVEEPSAE